MNKLIKPFFAILFILLCGLKTFGQQYYPAPPQPRRMVQPRRVVRPVYPGPYQQPYPGQHLNPGPVRQGPIRQGYPVGGGNRVGRVEVVKESFIGRQLNLSPQQSQYFWPQYRQYTAEMVAVRQAKRQNLSSNTTNPNRQLQLDFQYDTELVNIRKRYTNQFLRIMPPQKVNLLFKSEREFNDELVRQFGERSGIRSGN